MPSPLRVAFSDLPTLAKHLRDELQAKKFILLYAYNGTGKTRLSVAFKELGKKGDERDTLYFNAFTEDLFQWDNDLENDRQRVLKLNAGSRFFAGLRDLDMDAKIGALLQRYTDLNFYIDYEKWVVTFFRERELNGDPKPIKASRGEENLFVWCFFLALVELVVNDDERVGPYAWARYVYIDDPISSLDEHNAIAIANHLTKLLTKSQKGPKVVVSSHHALFFNVLCNELGKKARRWFLQKGATRDSFVIDDVDGQKFLQHLATLKELSACQRTGDLKTYHFNMMRRVMEQTANFFGMQSWKDCIRPEPDDPDKTLYERVINLMSHGDYAVFEAKDMMPENKALFRRIFMQFLSLHPFNPDLFVEEDQNTAS